MFILGRFFQHALSVLTTNNECSLKIETFFWGNKGKITEQMKKFSH
jgi:hypothetical protein